MATKQTQGTKQPQPVQPQHNGQGTQVWAAPVGTQTVALHHLFGRRYGVYSNGKFYGYMLARSPSHAVNRVAVAAGWAEFCATLATTNTYAARMAARKAAKAAGAAKAPKAKAPKAPAQPAPKAKGAKAAAAAVLAQAARKGRSGKAAKRAAKAPSLPTLAAMLA